MHDRTCVSLFSGVGGLDEGLRRAGFRHLLLCESDSYRRDVLRARFPGVPVTDDVARVGRLQPGDGSQPQWNAAGSGAIQADLLCGGFPCQDLSVAGQRRGLAGARSGLFFECARVADLVRPRWLLVENVPGLLSSNGGRDFGIVLGTLADLGYGLAWRILDSRFFGVPQRRRRVFIVGARADRDPRAAAERAGQVLAVGTRCPRHPATRGETRADVAVASLSGLGTGGPDDNDGQGGRLIAQTLLAKDGWRGTEDENFVAAPLTSGGHPNSNAPGRRKEDDENLVIAGPLGGDNDGIGRRSEDDPNLVTQPYTFDWQLQGSERTWIHDQPGQTRSLSASKTLALHEQASVRRLTPTECERLQAFPDGWTDLGGTPDSRRYAALGDAVTVNVAEWIGRRLVAA